MSDDRNPQPPPPIGVEPLELNRALRGLADAIAGTIGLEGADALSIGEGGSAPADGAPALVIDLRLPPVPQEALASTVGALAPGGVLIVRVAPGTKPAELERLGGVRRLPIRAAAGWLAGEPNEQRLRLAPAIADPGAAPLFELLVAGPAERLGAIGPTLGVDISAPVAALLADARRWEARARAGEAEAAAAARDAQLANLARQRALARLLELERRPLRRLGRLLRGRRGRIETD